MPNRPNILLLLSDQHNTHVGGFAGDPKAHTENLDRLSEGAVNFGAAYCQSPLCVPSRISLLTEQYAAKCCAWGNSSVLYPNQLTLPQHLSNNGYTTALVGKMHLKGSRWSGGFDYRPYGDLIVERFCFHQPDPPETWDSRWCNHRVGRFPWAGESQIPESLLADGVVTRESLAFLLEHQDKNPDRPWFLCAGYGRPHFPFTAPGRYFRRAMNDRPPLPPLPQGYPNAIHPHDKFIVQDFHLPNVPLEIQARGLAAYYACVDYMDDCIGELLERLKRAGLLDNTYVIYTSDHGEMAGEHGMWSKRSYYEGSAGVPLLIAGPGIDGARAINSPVELTDLFPTFCEMAGVEIPDNLDGESLMPILTGAADRRRNRFARSELLSPQGDVTFRMARDERWKYVEFPEHEPRLFDMVSDPGETTDLIGKAPSEAPVDDLRNAAANGQTWEDIDAVRQEETKRRPAHKSQLTRSPAQYQLRDGRIVDADNFLYEGLAESG